MRFETQLFYCAGVSGAVGSATGSAGTSGVASGVSSIILFFVNNNYY
jgi:hypothetical protein